MLRRATLSTCAALVLAAGSTTPRAQDAAPVVEASIVSLRQAMETGRTTSRAITEQYLARIARHEERLNAVISLNPRALEEADARDRERRQRRVRGPLHGIPIALKDNIHAFDMPTTGGALAFVSLRAPYEATLTRHLRDAGAVIIAKTTLTELANWVSPAMPAGYNSLTGFSFNPYDSRRTATGAPVVTPGGSSSGIGTAASFWAANVGTETSGSILNPASQTMLVGIKPTVGRISRHGVIPITADQDTPGPMARTVADAAILLGALEGASPDPNDAATRACRPPPGRDYTRHLRRDGLKGARLGAPEAGGLAALPAPQRRMVAEAIDAVRAAGATVVEGAELPAMVSADRSRNLAGWSMCVRPPSESGSTSCSIVLLYGMKRDFNRWLASLGSAAPVRTLTDLRAWNRAHEREGTLRFGQQLLDASDAIDLERDRARYQADLARDRELTGRDGIDAALRAHRLDALIFPSYLASPIPARAGYPSIIVPVGLLEGTSQAGGGGSDAAPTPFGITFTAGACSEPRLIEIAYAFEQQTRRRKVPELK
jgi:amidase